MTANKFTDPSCRLAVVGVGVFYKESSKVRIKGDVKHDLAFLLVWHGMNTERQWDATT
jgi:hypothetical protein